MELKIQHALHHCVHKETEKTGCPYYADATMVCKYMYERNQRMFPGLNSHMTVLWIKHFVINYVHTVLMQAEKP